MKFPDARGGDPRTKDAGSLADYFDARIAPDPNSGCWLWIGQSMANGYGVVNHNKRKALAHRVSYEMHKGEIPSETCVCHTCDNPACVNPSHLWLGSKTENNLDKIHKGRARGGSIKGTAHHSHKLADEDVIAIRRKYKEGATQTAIAKEYAMSQGQVWAIVKGHAWKHLVTACEMCAVGG